MSPLHTLAHVGLHVRIHRTSTHHTQGHTSILLHVPVHSHGPVHTGEHTPLPPNFCRLWIHEAYTQGQCTLTSPLRLLVQAETERSCDRDRGLRRTGAGSASGLSGARADREPSGKPAGHRDTGTHTRDTRSCSQAGTHVCRAPPLPPPPHTHKFIGTRVHTHEPRLCSCRLPHSSSLGGPRPLWGGRLSETPALAPGELKIGSLGPRCLSGCSAPCRQAPASERPPAPAPRGGAGLWGWLRRPAVCSGTQI